MKQICQYCKSYYNGKCINKDFKDSISATSSLDDEANKLFEEGYVAEYIREHLQTNDLIDIIINSLYEADYIKKNKKMISYSKLIDYDSFENEIVEQCDDVLSNLVLPRIKDVDISVEVKPNFSCKYWE